MTRIFARLRHCLHRKDRPWHKRHRKARHAPLRHTYSTPSFPLPAEEIGDAASSGILSGREGEDDTIPLVDDAGVLREMERRESAVSRDLF